MQNNVNQSQSYRIYDKGTRQWFEVSPEEFKEYDRWRTNLRKREQYHHRCMCPRSKWWLCDGMCDDCEFHARGDMLSMDAPFESDDGDEFTLHDVTADPDSLFESVICDQDMLNQLLKRLAELMPEASEIGRLRLKGLKDEDIADAIGIKRTTFRSRIEKARAKLREEYGEDFHF